MGALAITFLRMQQTSDFDFELPLDLVAQVPARERDTSRLFVVRRSNEAFEHRTFRDLPGFLETGDVLVLNNSRVVPARLRGANTRTGGSFEMLLLEEVGVNEWWVMMRPGKRARVGTRIGIADLNGGRTDISAEVIDTNAEGHRRVRFEGTPNIFSALDQLGEVPLPPYIERTDATRRELDRERYQTVYAQVAGSVAAPTAGLHFTPEMLEAIGARGVRVCFVTLHVGLGTFAPVKSETIEQHIMHEERFDLGANTVRMIEEAKRMGRRVVAVGTTTVRVLESVAAANNGALVAGPGRTRIFIHPPYQFAMVDGLITNFHLPRSTLLMLVSAFAAPGETRGRELVLAAYREAVRKRYRFFSYGDAMLVCA